MTKQIHAKQHIDFELTLGGITKKIQATIKKVQKPIDKAINKGVKAIAGKVKSWFGKKKPKKGDGKKIKEENKKGDAEKLDPKDKAKHKEIVGKIESKLKKNKVKDKEEFKDFHKRVEKQGEGLEDQYQPQLKKGINLDVSFKSVKEDEKDGDIDASIKIAPNTTEKKNIEISGGAKEGDWTHLKISTRHYPQNVKIPKKTGNTMFTVSKNEVAKDLSEIHKNGEAIRKGETFHPSSGRIYKIHEGSVHPVSGSPGTVSITSMEYNILVTAKKKGLDKAQLQLSIMLEKGLINSEQVKRTELLLEMVNK